MAQGSEQISEKWIEGAKRECVKESQTGIVGDS